MTKDFFFFLLPKFRKCVQHVLVVSVEDGNGEMMEEQFRSELLRQVVSIKDFFQPSILGTIFGRSGLDISRYLEAEGRHLDVSVDVETVVLAGQHHAAVIHQRHVETLRVLHLQPNIFRYTGNIFWPEILSCETKYFLALQKIIMILYLALQRGDELAVLREDGQVEVVVVVSDGDLPGSVDADTDGVVGDACNRGRYREMYIH